MEHFSINPDWSIPIVFDARYFLLEPFDKPAISVLIPNPHESVIVEIFRNKPYDTRLVKYRESPGKIFVKPTFIDAAPYEIVLSESIEIKFANNLNKVAHRFEVTDDKVQLLNTKFDAEVIYNIFKYKNAGKIFCAAKNNTLKPLPEINSQILQFIKDHS